MNLTKYEQETIVRMNREESVVNIYTANPVHLKRLRSDDRYTEVSTDIDSAMFEISTSDFNILGGLKRRRAKLSAEQRVELAERLKAAREK